MSNAREKKRAKKMKNQPTSVTFPSDSGPSHSEMYFRNGGDGIPQHKKRGNCYSYISSIKSYHLIKKKPRHFVKM